MGAFESALSILRVWRLMAGWPHWLSTVLAQDHFYSDFLSLLLTIQIHFESVMMIASAQHSLSVLTFVKLMIECVVHLLSRFVLPPLHLSFPNFQKESICLDRPRKENNPAPRVFASRWRTEVMPPRFTEQLLQLRVHVFSGGFGNGLLQQQVFCYWRRHLGVACLPISQSSFYLARCVHIATDVFA